MFRFEFFQARLTHNTDICYVSRTVWSLSILVAALSVAKHLGVTDISRELFTTMLALAFTLILATSNSTTFFATCLLFLKTLRDRELFTAYLAGLIQAFQITRTVAKPKDCTAFAITCLLFVMGTVYEKLF